MRKFGIKYSQLHPQHKLVREDFARVGGAIAWRDVLIKWYNIDAPGVHPNIEEPNPLATQPPPADLPSSPSPHARSLSATADSLCAGELASSLQPAP
jgi:hypothetical protein